MGQEPSCMYENSLKWWGVSFSEIEAQALHKENAQLCEQYAESVGGECYFDTSEGIWYLDKGDEFYYDVYTGKITTVTGGEPSLVPATNEMW